MDAYRKKLAALGPGLVLEYEDTSYLVSQVFLVDDLLVVFPTSPEGRVTGYKVSEVSAVANGYKFDCPGYLHIAVYPMSPAILPGYREVAEKDWGRDQAFAEWFVNGEESA